MVWLALHTRIPYSTWVDEPPEAILTALKLLEEQEKRRSQQ